MNDFELTVPTCNSKTCMTKRKIKTELFTIFVFSNDFRLKHLDLLKEYSGTAVYGLLDSQKRI